MTAAGWIAHERRKGLKHPRAFTVLREGQDIRLLRLETCGGRLQNLNGTLIEKGHARRGLTILAGEYEVHRLSD